MKKLELSATFGTLTGFFFISSQVFLIGYLIAIIGNVLWVIQGRKSKLKGLILVNSILMIFSFWGLYGLL